MSVVNKFNQKAKEYDSERRALIPCFDDFYGIAIDCIDFKGDNPKVLDLGVGTGILSQFLLEKYPNAEIVLTVTQYIHIQFNSIFKELVY